MKCDSVSLVILAASLLAAKNASAQWVKLNSTKVVKPRLSLGSLSLTVSPSAVNLTLVPKGQTLPSTTITVSSQINLTVLGSYSLWASFSTPSALTSPAGDVIPSSAVLGKCNTLSTYTPLTQTSPSSPGASLLIYQTNSLAALLLNTTQTCTLMIDLTNLPQLPAGTYTGTLQIQATAL